MNVSMKDLVIIEHALHELIAAGTDEQNRKKYQQVLENLHSQRQQTSQANAGSTVMMDGFRYDYDDASDLYEPRH